MGILSAVTLDGDRLSTTASGSMTLARDSIDTAQGLLAMRYRLAARPHWRVESGVAAAQPKLILASRFERESALPIASSSVILPSR